MKDFVAVLAGQLLRSPLIKIQESPVYFQNAIILVIDGQGIGKTVKNPEKESLGLPAHLFRPGGGGWQA